MGIPELRVHPRRQSEHNDQLLQARQRGRNQRLDPNRSRALQSCCVLSVLRVTAATTEVMPGGPLVSIGLRDETRP